MIHLLLFLEILDPEQNSNFNDHYIELDYDLSKVMFIATANHYEDIPSPLLDRMEIIDISGYTEQEKSKISENYLISKQMKEHGLSDSEISFTKNAIINIIRYYTREAGVRALDRDIAKICRKVVKQIISGDIKSAKITKNNIADYLGVHKYNYGEIESRNLIGITNGLSYSQMGGDILSIESVIMPNSGKGESIRITGKLGDVMKESIEAAFSYIRSRAKDFGIRPSELKKCDIHVHVPEGATPKDGPSAGIAICTSVVSALTKIPVRRDIAMTGEITLRGRVLPIGGLKEKLLGALRGGVTKVLIPKDNIKDLQDIPKNITSQLDIVSVEFVDQVLHHALKRKLEPLKWDSSDNVTDESSDYHSTPLHH